MLCFYQTLLVVVVNGVSEKGKHVEPNKVGVGLAQIKSKIKLTIGASWNSKVAQTSNSWHFACLSRVSVCYMRVCRTHKHTPTQLSLSSPSSHTVPPSWNGSHTFI